MTLYGVYSPEYCTTSSYQPPEYGCDYEIVEAPTAREAKWIAAKKWRKQWRSWVHDNLSDGKHPLSGIKVERLDDIPVEEDR